MKRLALIVSTIVLLDTQTHAGFADSLRELRGTLSQINSATKEVSNVTKELGSATGTSTTNTSSYTVGQNLYPKINNLPLYHSANKSSNVLTKLTKNTDLIFSGNVSKNGFIEVTTEYGNGWVEAHLVH